MFFWKKKEVKMKNEFKVGDIVYLKDDIRCEPYKVVEISWDHISHTIIGIKRIYNDDYLVVSEDCICKLNSVSYDRNPYDDVDKQTERDLDNFIDQINSEFLHIIKGIDKPKLKIKLYNEGNVVIYRVLEQCESLRKMSNFESKNGLQIVSISLPNIERDELYLRGDLIDRDNFVSVIEFESEQAAKEHIEKCLEALQEFADNNYFDGKSDTIEDIDVINDGVVYEF